MSDIELIDELKQNGCCDACCVRYLSVKIPESYNDCNSYINKLRHIKINESTVQIENKDVTTQMTDEKTNGLDNDSAQMNNGTRNKQMKGNPCITCLGVLQNNHWSDWIQKIKYHLESKNYDCKTFACAISTPTCLLLRTRLMEALLERKNQLRKPVISIKEAWKWSFCPRLQSELDKTLDSGSVSKLLVTCHYSYTMDKEELKQLEKLIPKLYSDRHKRRDFFSRTNIEKILTDLSSQDIDKSLLTCQVPDEFVTLERVSSEHSPIYFGGRYIKLCRNLPQTPWILNSRRIMESSVQEILVAPIAKLYNIPVEDYDKRMKLISAGREDVDVRCLDAGRPFAVELNDPNLTDIPHAALEGICQEISRSNLVIVKEITIVDRNELIQLKRGEETKTKSYQALCIKIPGEHKESINVKVTDDDINKLNAYTNSDKCRVTIKQKTPLRVLHRRPLLARERDIYEMKAEKIDGRDSCFLLNLKTQAGTYIKEFVHGDFGRTVPSVSDILGVHIDILLLDVQSVDLEWPKTTGRCH